MKKVIFLLLFSPFLYSKERLMFPQKLEIKKSKNLKADRILKEVINKQNLKVDYKRVFAKILKL